MYQLQSPSPKTDSALAAAEALCAGRGRRFTPHRRLALQILLESDRPLRAYDLLERLTGYGFAGQPPVAYRALDFLVEQGLVHKLSETKSFLPCVHPAESHGAAFLICRTCGQAEEVSVEPGRGAFGRAAREAGFTIERTILEAEGVCEKCS